MQIRRPEVLIIDDLMESVALLLRYLHGEAIDVMVALNGVDGLRKAREGQPDVILLDVCMPHIDGYAVCRQLKTDTLTAHIPVIFLSANGTLQHKLDGFAAGGVDYIAKPFSSEEVLARIFVHLRSTSLVKPQPLPGDGRLARPAAPELNREHQMTATALALFQEADQEWLGLEQLARKMGVNEKRLTELFRKHLGMSVAEYQITQRLESAREKLCSSSQQIQIIAEEAGYQNASDFSRAFRQRYGLGPREYRQASAGEPRSFAGTS
jgi:DNA-binding response OmpR family regulator